jgi:hypothetical protein
VKWIFVNSGLDWRPRSRRRVHGQQVEERRGAGAGQSGQVQGTPDAALADFRVLLQGLLDPEPCGEELDGPPPMPPAPLVAEVRGLVVGVQQDAQPLAEVVVAEVGEAGGLASLFEDALLGEIAHRRSVFN